MTRTERMRSRPPRLTVIWPCTRRCTPSRALAMISSSSGTISGKRMAERFRLGVADQLLRRAVEDADLAVAIDADDAGAGRRQHRLGETSPAVDDFAGADQVVALGAQFVGHLVEGLAELGEIALRSQHRHLDVRLPVDTRSAAPIRRRIGATSELAKFSAISTADISTVSAITANISASAFWTPGRVASWSS